MNRQIATFFLGDTLLGVDILLVKEIYRQMTITPVPDSPEHLCGLMNLRGRVVTVVDLNACLNRPPTEDIEKSRLLILKTDSEILKYQQDGQIGDITLGNDIVGFIIDGMDNVLTVKDQEILAPPSNLNTVEESLIEGVIKLGTQLVILLDINAILDRIMTVPSSEF
ncbi:purine-binding chemotaxis protein CheW [Candidatus Magnetomoraceae bacterium gMMP-15]